MKWPIVIGVIAVAYFIYSAYIHIDWSRGFDPAILLFLFIIFGVLLGIWMTAKGAEEIRITDKFIEILLLGKRKKVGWYEISKIKYLPTTAQVTYIWLKKKRNTKIECSFFNISDWKKLDILVTNAQKYVEVKKIL